MKKKDIEKYIIQLQNDERQFKNRSLQINQVKTKRTRIPGIFRIWKVINYFLISLLDLSRLYYNIRFNSSFLNNKRIVYTAQNFCTINDGIYEDRIVRPLFTENIVFLNQSKEYALKKVNGQKVYNLGGVVKVLSILFIRSSSLMKLFDAYMIVNNTVIRRLPDNQEVYMLWFYDLNCLSLVFSPYRFKITLIEVQHGSIVNYPPYSKPSPVKIANIFYVKNMPTIEYLKNHLCLYHLDIEYKIIPYPKRNRKSIPGLHILYASTIEFNGLHPVFINFLENNRFHDLRVIVRLHPREREKTGLFKNQLDRFNINYEFDNSKNWIESNIIDNLIVVSPWSSTIEDAYDNGFISITIDMVGYDRYRHLIDNKICFYSNKLQDTISMIYSSNNS